MDFNISFNLSVIGVVAIEAPRNRLNSTARLKDTKEISPQNIDRSL
jgi:hypothetical protein